MDHPTLRTGRDKRVPPRNSERQNWRGMLVVPAEVRWIIQRCAPDATSASLRETPRGKTGGARLSCPQNGERLSIAVHRTRRARPSEKLREAKLEGHACRARRIGKDYQAWASGRDERVPPRNSERQNWRGTLVVPAESGRIIKRGPADATSASLRETPRGKTGGARLSCPQNREGLSSVGQRTRRARPSEWTQQAGPLEGGSSLILVAAQRDRPLVSRIKVRRPVHKRGDGDPRHYRADSPGTGDIAIARAKRVPVNIHPNV
jgi:hypothetical protein